MFNLCVASQGNVLQHNVSAGVIVSETSLVLQRVSRHATGRYTCHASNTEGEGSSQAFQLNVLRKYRSPPLFAARCRRFFADECEIAPAR